MESILLASGIVAIAVLVAAILIGRALRRSRARSPVDESNEPAEFARLAAELRVLTRRIEAMEDDRAAAAWTPPPNASAPRVVADTSTAPRISPRIDLMLREVPQLASNGRLPMEIAQLLGVDIGEVELVMQLERARVSVGAESQPQV